MSQIQQLFALLLTMPFYVFGHIPEALGDSNPPAIYDGYSMTNLIDNQGGGLVSEVEGIGGSPLSFDPSILHGRIGVEWPLDFWGYSEGTDVYWTTSSVHNLKMYFPDDTCAFIFYTQSFTPGTWKFIVEYSNGETIEEDIATSWSGGVSVAEGFGISHDAMDHAFPESVSISMPETATGFIIGQFSMALCSTHDADGDGVPDPIDMCPNNAFGIPDHCDTCCVDYPSNSNACHGLMNGNYHSCDTCHAFITCSNNYAYVMQCAPNGTNPPLEYDVSLNACVWENESTTTHCCSH